MAGAEIEPDGAHHAPPGTVPGVETFVVPAEQELGGFVLVMEGGVFVAAGGAAVEELAFGDGGGGGCKGGVDGVGAAGEGCRGEVADDAEFGEVQGGHGAGVWKILVQSR